MNADGWITVKTKVDNKQLRKDVNASKKELEKLKKEEETLTNKKAKIEAQVEIDGRDFERKIAEIEKKRKIELEANTRFGKIEQSKESAINSKYDIQVDRVTAQYNKKLDKANTTIEEIDQKLSKNVDRQKELNGLIDVMNAKLKKGARIDALTDEVKNIKGHIKDTVKQVGKWALAVFGVRSAYLAIRSAVSTLSQYNEKIGADIEYIRYSLATVLQPLIERLISLVYKFLSYINLIAKAWFNVDLFARASAKNMNKANKTAKEMSKTLLGFDEINQLQDNSSSSGDSVVAPSVDLSNLDIEVPGWLQWILDNKDTILAFFWGIVGAITAMKLADVANNLGLINGHLSALQALGIVGFIFSLYELVKKLQEIWEKFDGTVEDNNTTMTDWGEVIIWVGLGIISLAAIIGLLPVAVAGAIVLIIGLIMKNWEKIKTFFTEKVIGWIDKKIEAIEKGALGGFITRFLYQLKGTIREAVNIIDGIFLGFKQIFDGIILIFKGDFKKGFISIGKGLVNEVISIINIMISALNSITSPIRELIVTVGKVLGKNWNMDNIRIPHINYLASGGIIDAPKKGVALGNGNVGGEAGPEAVIPLTDDTLQRLANMIPITIDLTNEIDGRVLNRILKTIDQRDRFARNGG